MLSGTVAVVATALLFHTECVSIPAKSRSHSIEVSPVPPEATAIGRRTDAKLQLARRLIIERLPLLDVAEQFAVVNGEYGMRDLIVGGQGRSVREKLCRQVIVYVILVEEEMKEEGHSWSGPRVSEELQRELDRRLAAGEFPPEPEMKSTSAE